MAVLLLAVCKVQVLVLVVLLVVLLVVGVRVKVFLAFDSFEHIRIWFVV